MEATLKTSSFEILTCKPDSCVSCQLLFDGYCSGNKGHCGYHGQSSMSKCNQECATCGGGDAAPHTVPAICCKSPLAKIALSRVTHSYTWQPRDVIKIKQQGIIVIQGAVGGRVQDPYPKETQAIAVSLRHVWSGKGWYSRDMKDYLHLPKKVKLILLTMTHDAVLEKAWDNELYEEDWSKNGFDYWQPLTFSQYYADSKMNGYWQWRRTLHATERGNGWFTPCIPSHSTKRIEFETAECAKAIPQFIFNWQFRGRDLLDSLKYVRRHHALVPKTVPFWFVGPASRRPVRMLKRLLKSRPVYFLTSVPWLLGQKGMAYNSEGLGVKSFLSKDELIPGNQLAYMDMVSTL